MKNLLLSILLLNTFVIFSQCDTLRYRFPVVNSITSIMDVKYGEAPVWSFPYQNTDLLMDIYLPENDNISNRPLMLWVHAGGFLTGDKTADDMVALCDSFARRGYVTATVGYRLGFNPVSAASAERAVYRGTQDMRAAIRFLKENASTYGIDTNYTFIGGSSAGGFAAVQTAYMDQIEAPSSIDGGFTYPSLGCLDCEGNGFIHGINLKGYTNLWGAIGDSLWINSDETVPGLLVHGTSDGTVPYGVGHPFGVFTTPLTHGSRCISNQLNSLSISHSKYIIPNAEHEPHGADNGTFNSPPTPYWDTIFNKVNRHYYSILKPNSSSIIGTDEVCTEDTVTYRVNLPTGYELCWEVNGGALLNGSGDSIQAVFTSSGQASVSAIMYSEIKAPGSKIDKSIDINESPWVGIIAEMDSMEVTFSPSVTGFTNYIWDFGDGNGSSNLSPSHIYSGPGDYLVSLTVVDQNGCSAQMVSLMDFNTLNLVSDNKNSHLEVYPNPVSSKFKIISNNQMGEFSIHSMSGEELLRTTVNQNEATIDIAHFPSGIYIGTVVYKNQTLERLKIIKN
jgi:poly(3-hydroxybutyrate) depolymerase